MLSPMTVPKNIHLQPRERESKSPPQGHGTPANRARGGNGNPVRCRPCRHSHLETDDRLLRDDGHADGRIEAQGGITLVLRVEQRTT